MDHETSISLPPHTRSAPRTLLCGARRARPRAEVVAAVVAVACYINVLPNDFCNDGSAVVERNPKVNAPGQWASIWTTDYWSETVLENPSRDLLYRPASLLSYRVIRVLFGVHALPHHVVNLLLHALVCILVVRLCRHLGGSEAAAGGAALVFAVLPVHTEVLNNVVGRADLLAAVGVLLSLLAHRRGMQAANRAQVAGWRLAACLAGFVAMASKESGIGVMLLVPIFDAFWWKTERRLEATDGDAESADDRGRWLSRKAAKRLTYLLIPAGAYVLLRYQALGGHLYQRAEVTKTINVLADAPSWQRGLGVIQLWGMYWAKTIWPQVLCVNYSINAIRLATSLLDPYVLLGVGVGVGLLVAAGVSWRRGQAGPAVLVTALVVTYAPTANAFVLIQVFFAERIWYLPSVWVALLAGFAASAIARRSGRSLSLRRPGPLSPSLVVVAVILMAMTVRCWLRNAEWRNSGTLYAAAYDDLPDAVGVRYLYGQWLVTHGAYERGVDLLEQALDIDLGFVDAHRALGQAYLKSGNLTAAARHLRIASMQVPGHPPTEAALARVSRALSRRDETLHRLRRQAAAHPNDVRTEIELVRRLRTLGLVREALNRLQEREKDFAFHADWQAEYAATLVYLNQRDQAIDRYRTCLDLKPTDPQRAVELAMLLLERRRGRDLDEAWSWAMHAQALAPGAPPVLACRAELLALKGDLAAAVALYEEAIDALPVGSRQRRRYAERAASLGWRPRQNRLGGGP